MKTHHTRIGAIALFFCAHLASALAVTFSHDAFISVADSSFEGADIVVTNCTLTVDGPHTFNSLQLLNGARLTHSPFSYGPQQITFAEVGESHLLSATNPATLDNTNIDPSTILVTDGTGTFVYTENVDYVVTFSNQFTLLNLTTNSSIGEGASVLVDYEWDQEFQGFNLGISNDVIINSGGAINVSGKGYAGGIGFPNGAGTSRATNFPFAFAAGGGGAHGGAGGMSSTFARGGASYDSTTQPGALGSGGGAGNSQGGGGGGVAILSIGGNLQLDGQILADGLRGTNSHCGGGGGGSIFISAQNFSGAGTVSAKGGTGDLPDGGGGGGGRVAIYFATNAFTGNMFAFGGAGATAGGAGTIYLQSTASPAGQLFIVNGGKRGTNTTFSAPVSDLTISGGAVTQPPGSTFSVTNLFVGSNSLFMPTDSLPLALAVIGDATVESNAVIGADATSSSGFGPGSFTCGNGSGGSHGGYGGLSVCGAPTGILYDSLAAPGSPGSPGGGPLGGRGGGVINMIVTGTLSLSGSISANGGSGGVTSNSGNSAPSSSGGGSGGSIYLVAGTLAGGGTISANGGPANNLGGGGGGGGRIAVHSDTNWFTGIALAHGGAGTNAGGPGSVYWQTNSSSVSLLVVDNGGLPGKSALLSMLTQSDLQISGGSILTNYSNNGVSLRSLFIGSNSWWIPPSSTITKIDIAATNITIQAGGGIYADGVSSLSGFPGQSSPYGAGGGGNAGNGGNGLTNGAAGGAGTENTTAPSNTGGLGGSGGGAGGLGGGVIKLSAKILQLDGALTANGSAGMSGNAGGGAGGSIAISAGAISGTGRISANGGAGSNNGGGGGGGGIAISSDTNTFSGPITAFGGPGINYGGAGTIYLTRLTPNGSTPSLTVDNGGIQGARTPLSFISGTVNLTITNGAAVSNAPNTQIQLGNLNVGSNSMLLAFSTSQQSLTVFSNATVFAGGTISLNGANTIGSTGMGQTINSTGGGGGNAGYGGASASNAAGGVPFSDSLTSPLSLGGRGGGGITQGFGGLGGGSLRLTVNNILRVDGRISADGTTSPTINSGGGAGGTVFLSVKTFSGNGVISANGGAGNASGGGGGGGRISVSYASNFFTGNLMAIGGAGANNGGAGLVYTFPNPTFQGSGARLTLDNGGLPGSPTPISATSLENASVTVTGGAVVTNASLLGIGGNLSMANLLIGSNGTWLSFSPSRVSITVASNATIQAGGRLTSDGCVSTGPTPGGSANGAGGGAGHGGYGGAGVSNAPGGNITTSESASIPTLPGSQGGLGGGLGGGAFQLTVRGMLQLDGRISANGATSSNLNSGGGSGGSVALSVNRFSGNGSVSANGGPGRTGGGGGAGGRVAISYSSNLFTGSITAAGGSGANDGGAGTVYVLSNLQLKRPTFVIDNGGSRGTNTVITSDANGADVTIGGGASGILSSGQSSWNSLTIASNSSLSFAPQVTSLNLTISSNMMIQPGGAVLLDGQGSSANNGQGAGSLGAGGGHGGYGSSSAYLSSHGGTAYDSITSPAIAGSGGSATSGSAGGGALHLTVSGILTNNGLVSANGISATTSGGGGGSGGSLWLSLGMLTGTGKISVNGGDGELFGGGGGGAGGRISVSFNSNHFNGTFSAHGGAGIFLAGGAGTIYLKTNSSNTGLLVLDNGGDIATNTPLDLLSGLVSLSVSNGAVASSMVPLTVQNLAIGDGGKFAAVPAFVLNLTSLGNALINPGGALSADFAGWDFGAGSGAGSVDYTGAGGGGGYGGAGGMSWFGAPGGNTYGSSNQPTQFGSPGGVSPNIVGYSQGGGAIRLQVHGTLTVNGDITANGNDGLIDGAGGGSGGSIWITTRALSGNGSLNANGGVGESIEGGGGGGGRIAINGTTNGFTGTVSATGGDGAFPGQDGTIYVASGFLVSGAVLNSNGTPVSGVTLISSGIGGVNSDSNGCYAVTVPPFWTGIITPTVGGIILPASRSYSAISADAANQNFITVSPSAFNLTGGQFDGTNVNLNWYGYSGATYQVQCSTNLVDWTPYGPPFPGTNGPASFATPPTNAPQMYFRLGVSY